MRLRGTGAALAVAAWMTLGACASQPQPRPREHVFALHDRALPTTARPFALGADGPGIYVTRLGSWAEPLRVDGVVLDTRVRGGVLPVRSSRWLGQHGLVLGSGDRRVVLQYDTPSGPAPVHPGERVSLRAHTMVEPHGLAFTLSVHDSGGKLQMAGLRTSDPNAALWPEGWSVAFGPVLDQTPVCGGRAQRRALRVRGPGGEAIVSPGWTSVADLGSDGSSYAVDVSTARTVVGATCARAGETELSVVVRRTDRRRAWARHAP